MERTEEQARKEFRAAMRPLLSVDRRTFDEGEWLVFFESLRDIPPVLLRQAVVAMARMQRTYPFRPGDIRAAAESCRQQLLAADPWRPCSDCRELKGFVEITDQHGVQRMQKCGCIAAYNRRLLEAGIPLRPLQIEAAAEERAS